MTREALARALTGTVGLGESPSHDAAPVDRLHVAAAIQRPETYLNMGPEERRYTSVSDALKAGEVAQLGVAIIAWRDGGAQTYYAECVERLAAILSWPSRRFNLKPGDAENIARQVLQEAKLHKCADCRGRGMVPDVRKMHGRVDDGPVPSVPCETCHGTTIRRYSDEERAQILGEKWRVLSGAMSAAEGIVGWACKEVEWNYRRFY